MKFESPFPKGTLNVLAILIIVLTVVLAFFGPRGVYACIGLGIILLFVLRAIYRESKAENSKAQMEGIFSHGTQGIILTDQHGNIVLMNPFSEKLFGYASDELMKHKIALLIPDLVFSEEDLAFEKLSGQLRKEVLGKRKDNHSFPIEISLNRYKSRKKTFVVAFITDISLRKQDEEILRAKKSELEDVNKELESFTYSVSHDLRAPLRAVGGYAKMLEEDFGDKLDDEGKRLLLVIRQSAEAMGTLIDDLLGFSRLGKKEIRKSLVDMNEIANKALNEINKTVKHKAQVIIHPLHPIMADQALMGHIMTNILSNAIKYSSKEENPIIEIRSSEKFDEVVYSVQDNGAGFDMEYSQKLFGVFQRMHSSDEFEGTGVGLAIAQRIVLKHGGKIWAKGKEGEGATFYFSLPTTESASLLTENLSHLTVYYNGNN